MGIRVKIAGTEYEVIKANEFSVLLKDPTGELAFSWIDPKTGLPHKPTNTSGQPRCSVCDGPRPFEHLTCDACARAAVARSAEADEPRDEPWRDDDFWARGRAQS